MRQTATWALFGVLACASAAAAQTPDYLLDGAGGHLLDQNGGSLLVQEPGVPVPNPDDQNTQITLRTRGDPHTTGRMLSLSISVSPDKSNLSLRAFATDGTNEVTAIELLANGNRIAFCQKSDPLFKGICNFDWPMTSMPAGNSSIQFITSHANTTARYQIYVLFGKP